MCQSYKSFIFKQVEANDFVNNTKKSNNQGNTKKNEYLAEPEHLSSILAGFYSFGSQARPWPDWARLKYLRIQGAFWPYGDCWFYCISVVSLQTKCYSASRNLSAAQPQRMFLF